MDNFRRGVLYKMLEDITGKKRNTIKMYFNRHKMNVTDFNDFLHYINKYK